MLNYPPEYIMILHDAELARFLAAAEHRRNVERRLAGGTDPVPERPVLTRRKGFLKSLTAARKLRAR
ncbi:hypothetical protein [Arthrobacter sp. CAN_C5]|uniref:hypothetical protein n=1 Tax=Arthrobacter sp. CAN_C5 TaxID=2760706 RepID=UPI001AEA35D6|nr:hypothetical protein [Arthrobacter sp. CAN_C5]MBP2217003.1 hypothetical protein [Arthrobacter sp. CAN_C5]